ncbi:MAG: hypothetical protein OFPI_45160 [Osedax symbiont Rs2]|nr:MAG: hypothetical protein OFPI_45160 [Osedax symbiont Rs2]
MSHQNYNTYKEYTAFDFIEDEYFIRWVKNPDDQSEQFWKMWVAKYPEKAKDLMLAKSILLNLGYQHDPKLSEDDYVEMFEGALKRSRMESGKSGFLGLSFLPALLKVAALITIVLGVVFSVDQVNLANKEAASHVAMVTKQSPLGQKIITWLEDGTKVHLNAGSQIIYPSVFSDSIRAVTVKGEAYFEVAKDAGRPFIVNTEKVRTTVLGTIFNVRAYPDENKVDIAVEEGVVRVETKSTDQTDSKILRANEMNSYDLSSNKSYMYNIDPEDVFAWTNGVISFKAANINEIVNTLERWYGVTFNIKLKLNTDKDFSFRYKNKSLEEILDGLGFAYGFEYKIDDKTITLY